MSSCSLVSSAGQASKWLELESGEPLDNELFRFHFDRLPKPAYIWRRCGDDFELIAYNEAAMSLANGDVAQVLGVMASVLFRDRADIQAVLRRCAESQVMEVQETDLEFVSGVTLRMLITRIPISPRHVVTHMEDVTLQRASQEALAASERRFRALVEAQPDLIFRMTADGEYLDVHAPTSATLPFPGEELIGRTVAQVFGADAAAQHRHYASIAIATGRPQVLEYSVSVGGREIQVESRIIAAGRDEVVVNIRDTTDKVAIEQALLKSGEDERARLGRSLHEELANLRADVERLRAAHSGLAVAEGEASGDEAAALLGEVRARIDCMARLASSLDPVPAGTGLLEALADLASSAERLFRIPCRVTAGPNVPPLIDQTPQLYRVAQEAIASAVKHGGATSVEIICVRAGSQVLISVADDGAGFRMSADDNAALGMRVMRHRVNRFGGAITRSIRRDGGTVVTFNCPAT